MSVILELFKYLLIKKKFWLFPIIIILLIFFVFVILGEGSALSPFIYTLF